MRRSNQSLQESTAHTWNDPKAKSKIKCSKPLSDELQPGNSASATEANTKSLRALETVIAMLRRQGPAHNLISECFDRWTKRAKFMIAAVRWLVSGPFFIRPVCRFIKRLDRLSPRQ